MSTAGDSTAAGSRAYFCYQCDRVVDLTPSANSELSCPNCNGGFLEEHDQPSNPNPNPDFDPSLFSSSVFPPVHPFSDPFFSSPLSGLPGFSTFESGSGLPGAGRDPIHFPSSVTDFDNEGFNPFEFLRNHLENLRASGANIQFVIENHPSDQGGSFHLPSNLGDYFLGPGLEQLIQQLAENDPNRYGTPPASKKAIECLPSVAVTEELIKSDSAQCAVCMNDFELGSEAKQMPCNHIYHSDCILPWLELHNSCPVCRYELPTDDPEYETKRDNQPSGNLSAVEHGAGTGGGTVAGGSAGGASSGGVYERSPSLERRVRIALPWPFSSLTSGGSSGNDGGEGSGSGSQQGAERGREPRQEGLD